MTTYRILATVSGGITGYREGWAKDINGNPREYPDMESAKKAAREMMDSVGYGPVRFTYTAVEHDA